MSTSPKAPSAMSVYTSVANRFGIDEQDLKETLKKTAFSGGQNAITDEQMTALLIVADQYRLNPFTKELYAYPDYQKGIVPVVSIDGWSRIMNEHPAFNGMEFVYSTEMLQPKGTSAMCHEWIECVIYRKDRAQPITAREYLDECYREPFAGSKKKGPWQSHPKRMLRHKAMIQAARMAFAFAGIYDDDEAKRILDATEGSETAVVSIPKVVTVSATAERVVNPPAKPVSEATPAALPASVSRADTHTADIKLGFLKKRLSRPDGLDNVEASYEYLEDQFGNEPATLQYAKTQLANIIEEIQASQSEGTQAALV